MTNGYISGIFPAIHTYDSNSTWFGGEIVAHREVTVSDKYGKIEITPHSVKTSFNDNKNLLAVIEVLKDILINNSIITEEDFENLYNEKQNEYEEKIDSYKVADKLIEESKPKRFDFDFDMAAYTSTIHKWRL